MLWNNFIDAFDNRSNVNSLLDRSVIALFVQLLLSLFRLVEFSQDVFVVCELRLCVGRLTVAIFATVKISAVYFSVNFPKCFIGLAIGTKLPI